MKYSIYLFYFFILLPTTFSLSVGGLVLTPLRIFGMVSLVSALYLLKRNAGYLKPSVKIMDILIIFHCSWVFIAVFMNQGVGRAVESGGIYFVEFLGFYCFGRAVASSLEDFDKFLKVTFYFVVICSVFAWIESLSGVNVINRIMGLPAHTLAEGRFGLARANVSLPHAILYGFFASVFMGLYVKSRPLGFYRNWLMFFFATIPSLSSGPLLSMVIQSGLLFWDRLFRRNKNRWKVLIGLILFVLVALSLASNRSIVSLIISYVSLDPRTGFYRVAIWDYGFAEVLRNPLFGMGIFDEWIRAVWMYSTSVDNFWLLNMMRYGIPSLLALVVFKIMVVIHMLRVKDVYMRGVNTGWIISMVAVVFVGATVAIWANALSLYAVFLGFGGSLASIRKRD